jgi:hypothetical protein
MWTTDIADRGANMAYGIVLEFTGVEKSQYDAVNEKLGIDMTAGTGDFPFGLISHGAGPIADGWLVTEIWESKSAQQAFMGSRLAAALAAVGVPAPSRMTDSDLVSFQTP